MDLQQAVGSATARVRGMASLVGAAALGCVWASQLKGEQNAFMAPRHVVAKSEVSANQLLTTPTMADGASAATQEHAQHGMTALACGVVAFATVQTERLRRSRTARKAAGTSRYDPEAGRSSKANNKVTVKREAVMTRTEVERDVKHEFVTDVNPDVGPQGTYQVGIDFHGWLQSAEEEATVESCRVDGKLPAWMRGALVHAGPAKFEFGDDEFVDWVDGQAMLYMLRVREDGSVEYKNRWLNTSNHKAHRAGGKISVRETCSRPSIDNIFERVTYLFSPPDNENGNLHISNIVPGRNVSMSVGSSILEFSMPDLKTLGKVPFDDPITEGGPLIFHTEPHTDFHTGEWFTCAIQLFPRPLDYANGGWKPQYVVFSVEPDQSQVPGTPIKRREITRIDTEYPSPIHTMGVTSRFIILVQIPYPLNWEGMWKAESHWVMTGEYEGNLNDYNTWEPERPTLIRVIDRVTGEHTAVFETVPMFFFHVLNSWEEKEGDSDCVYIDLVGYDEPPVGFPLKQARSGDVEDWRGGGGDVRRFRLDLTTGECTWSGWPDNCFDEPKVNPRYHGEKYRYCWGVQDDHGTLRLVKLDCDEKSVKYWETQDVSRELPWQPVFVPEPYNEKEDAGVLVSFVRDQPTGNSSCVILDSITMEEKARIHFPEGHHIPLHGHGTWMQGTI